MKQLSYRGRTRLMDLEDKRGRIKNNLDRCEALIKQVKDMAVTDGVAMWTEASPRWGAPAKNWWMKNHGVKMWEKVRKSQNVSPVFTWLIS